MCKTVSGKPDHPIMTVKQKRFSETEKIQASYTSYYKPTYTHVDTHTHTCAETIYRHLGAVQLTVSIIPSFI